MKLFKKSRALVAPALVAAIMATAPGILLQDAQAQRDRGDRDGRNRDRDHDHERDHDHGDIVVININDNWYGDRYWGPQRGRGGKPTIDLNLDPNYPVLKKRYEDSKSAFEAQEKLLAQKDAAIEAAQKDQARLEKEINDLTTAIGQSISEQLQLKRQLPGLQANVQAATGPFNLAKAAHDSEDAELNKLKQKLAQLEQNCSATPTPECQNAVAQAKAKVSAKTSVVATLKADMDKKKATLDAATKALSDANTKIAKIDQDNIKRDQQKKIAEGKLVQAKQAVAAAEAAKVPVLQAYNQKRGEYGQNAKAFKNYRDNLIEAVITMNDIGRLMGSEAGATDGQGLALGYGQFYGQRDGMDDGTRDGTAAGQEREYRLGITIGRDEGARQGESDGTRDGQNEGTVEGNRLAGVDAGAVRGTNEAAASDAASVGSRRGIQDGMNRAIETGKRNGTAEGEREGINKYENKTLDSGSAEGSFAGAFEFRVPVYPGFNCIQRGGRYYGNDDWGWRTYRDWNIDRERCPNLNIQGDYIDTVYRMSRWGGRFGNHIPRAMFRSPVLKEAFRDGYLYAYRLGRYDEYQRNIEGQYRAQYQGLYTQYEEEYRMREYPQYRERGRNEGFNAVYSTTYTKFKEIFFAQYRDSFHQNPDTNSQSYRTAEQAKRDQVYRSEYARIEADAHRTSESETFNDNIAAQTEKYRKLRFDVVSNIYKNNAVLKFVSSEIVDGGINGVAAKDGITQPGEALFHNVTIKNFGLKPATGVSIVMDNGAKSKLPAIAAGSTVTIKGAAKSEVKGSNGSVHRSTLNVYAPVTAESGIQARHFANISNGNLSGDDSKRLSVQYPIQLSSLSTDSQMLLNKEHKMSVNVRNISNRTYGKVNVELSVAGNASQVIQKGFNNVEELGSSANLADALVQVNDKRDAFKDLVFTTTVSKNGVKLGEATTFRTMAKAPYEEKLLKPVIVANSDVNAEDLIDTLAQLGGIENASVLDLSLSGLNANVLRNGLNNKTMLILSDSRGQVVGALNATLQKSQDNALIFVDDNGRGRRGIDHARVTGVFTNAKKYDTNFTGFGKDLSILFVNSPRNGSKSTQVNAAMQASASRFSELLDLGQILSMGPDRMLAQMKKSINRDSYFKPSALLQAFNLTTLAQLEAIESAYKEDGKDKDWYKKVSSDSTLYFNKLKDAASSTKVDENGLSIILPAIAMNEVVGGEFGSFLANKVSATISKELKDMVKSFDKKLKKFDSDLRSKADDNAKEHHNAKKEKQDEETFITLD